MYRFAKVLICVLFPFFVLGQDYHVQVRHITSRDGLPNEYVHGVFQASDKNVWIATNYGTVYYDGAQVHELSIPLDFVTVNTYEDTQGKIWLVHFGVDWLHTSQKQTYIYDPQQKRLITFDEYFGKDIPIKLSEIVHITNDPGGNIWLYTYGGLLFRYDGVFQEVVKLPPEPARKIRNTEFQIVLGRNEYFISGKNWNFLWQVDLSGDYEKTVFPNAITHIQQNKDGTVWVITDNTSGVYKLNENGFEHVPLVSPVEHVIEYQSIVRINAEKKQIWYVDKNYMRVYDYSGRLLSFQTLDDRGVNFNTVVDLYFDADGRAWLATDYGIYIIELFENKFTRYLYGGIFKDSREILVAESGVVFVALQGKIYSLKEQKEVFSQHPMWFVSIAKKDNTFYGTEYSENLMKVNPITGEQQKVHIDDRLFASSLMNPILHFSEKTGRLWIGGDKVLGIVDTATLDITSFQQLNGFTSLLDNNIRFFYETDEGIWLTTTNGLYLLDENEGIVAHYADMLPERRILHMHEDQEGIFWLATERGGLLRWDRTTDEVQQFTKKDGLSHNVIYAVYEDDFGYLWLPSQYGLMRFNKESYDVNIYLPEEGIIHPEFNRLSHAQAPDGRLYFGGLGGVISFHPSDFIEEQPDETPLRIVAFEKLDGRDGENYDFTEELVTNQKITLEPHEISFRLDFVFVNFEKPEQNQYAYRIDDINKEWQLTNENFVRINGLPYGNYTLHIKGQNISKNWSQNELVIPIEARKPFYLQWWFFALMLGLLAFAVFVFVKMRTRALLAEKTRLEAEVNRRTATIRQQAEELKQLDEMKTHFFHNVAHELRTPLTLIATPITYHLRQLEPDNKWSGFLASIQRNVQHLMRLVESILDLSKFDAQQLELQEEPVNFTKLIHQTFYTYESYAELHQTNYQLDYKANTELLLLLDMPKFEKILHNLLFNALKFTEAGDSVTLRVREFEREVQIEVIDTGKGIAPDDLERIFDRYYQVEASEDTLRGGAGIGLSIAQEYVSLMGGKLTATSTPGEGSTFKLVIPKREAPGASATDELSNIGGESEQPVALAANGENRDRYHILLVEDNVEMQDLLRQIIEPHHDVIQAPNGLVALEKLRKHRVDGVITDIMMPQMDGFELVKRLKAHKKWQSLPVVVLTARANDLDKLEALRIGVDDYLYKPFSAEELVVRIENLISNRISRLRMAAPMPKDGSQNADQHWLQKVEKSALSLLEERSDFKLSDLANRVHLSERHLRRRIQEASGMTASDYLREIRLQQARKLLESPARKSVAEIANAVGFASAGYFSKLFYERFGRKPSDYL